MVSKIPSFSSLSSKLSSQFLNCFEFLNNCSSNSVTFPSVKSSIVSSTFLVCTSKVFSVASSIALASSSVIFPNFSSESSLAEIDSLTSTSSIFSNTSSISSLAVDCFAFNPRTSSISSTESLGSTLFFFKNSAKFSSFCFQSFNDIP